MKSVRLRDALLPRVAASLRLYQDTYPRVESDISRNVGYSSSGWSIRGGPIWRHRGILLLYSESARKNHSIVAAKSCGHDSAARLPQFSSSTSLHLVPSADLADTTC